MPVSGSVRNGSRSGGVRTASGVGCRCVRVRTATTTPARTNNSRTTMTRSRVTAVWEAATAVCVSSDRRVRNPDRYAVAALFVVKGSLAWTPRASSVADNVRTLRACPSATRSKTRPSDRIALCWSRTRWAGPGGTPSASSTARSSSLVAASCSSTSAATRLAAFARCVGPWTLTTSRMIASPATKKIRGSRQRCRSIPMPVLLSPGRRRLPSARSQVPACAVP
jgi:hypothetical protein